MTVLSIPDELSLAALASAAAQRRGLGGRGIKYPAELERFHSFFAAAEFFEPTGCF